MSPEEGVPEGYVTIIQGMYNDCETLVSTRTGDTEYFHVEVGLHQGSALSPLLFILTMYVLQAEIGKEQPWVMLFADDLVICEHSRAEVEIQLERWRETFDSHGLRVSKGKTEYMPCPDYLHSGKGSEDSENVQVSGFNVRCQRRSRERCKQQSKDCLVKVEGNYWGDVRQEHTNKVER